MLREWLAVGILTLLAIAGGAGVLLGLEKLQGIEVQEEDGPELAPAFSISLLGQNESVALSDYRGKVVLLDLMASWCTACIDGMPALERLQAQFADDDFVLLSIGVDNVGDTPELLEGFRDRYGGDWTFGYDTDGIVNFLYSVVVLPTFVLIDADGYIAWRGEGLAGEDLLESLIQNELDR